MVVLTIIGIITKSKDSFNLLIASFIGILGFVVIELTYKKMANRKRLIMSLTGTFLFLVFSYILFTISIYIYPFIIVYTAVFSIYANKIAVYLINLPYILLAIVRIVFAIVTKTNGNEFSEVIIMLFALVTNCTLLSIVASTIRKEQDRSNEVLKMLMKRIKKSLREYE